MRGHYIFIMFVLCLLTWAVVVDNAVLPDMNKLKQDVGQFSRYRVRKWGNGGKFDFVNDQLLVYAVVDDRERLYYMDYKPYFEFTLKGLDPGTPIQLRHTQRFPKVWKKMLYDLRIGGISTLRYSPAQLAEKQTEIWKFSAIMGGAFLVLAILGLIGRKKRG